MLATMALFILCLFIMLQSAMECYSAQSGLILDITQLLSELDVGDTSKEEFVLALSSGKCSNSSSYSFFYRLESWETKSAVRKEMWQVSQILQDSLDPSSTIKLLTSWGMYDTIVDEVAAINSTVWTEMYYFPSIQLNIVFYPKDGSSVIHKKEGSIGLLKLDAIRNILGISNIQNMTLGIIYFEFYHLLENLHTTDVTFAFLIPDIEGPLDLEDFLNYFQTVMNPKRPFSGLEMVYAPNPMFYRGYRNLALFRIFGDVPNVCIIFRIPEAAEYQALQPQKFSVIPHLSSGQLNPLEKNPSTHMLLLVLDAAAQGFNTFLLRHRQLQQLQNKEISNVFRRYRHVIAATPLQFIIDYSEEKMRPLKISHFAKDWKTASVFGDRHTVVNVEAFVFKLAGNDSSGYEFDVSNLKNHMSDFPTKPKTGCSLSSGSFEHSNANKIVVACKSIGGGLYILKLAVALQWKPKHSTDFHRDQYMKKILAPVTTLRNEILQLHQDATVYLQVDVIGVNEVFTLDTEVLIPLSKNVLSQSLFCHPGLQIVQQILVGIITWANAINFPLILNSALSLDVPIQEADGEWLSFLRKVPHINRNHPHKQQSCNEELQYTFPIGHNDKYVTDPCIHWIEVKPEITQEYFQNNNIGTIFHTDNMQHNGVALTDVLTPMLQLLFHGFYLIEIVSSFNFPEILTQIAYLQKSDSKFARNATVYINYIEKDHSLELSRFAEFLDQIENTLTILKGIHVDLAKCSVSTIGEQNHTRYDSSKCLQLQSIFDHKTVAKTYPGLQFGILVPKESFFDLIQYFATEAEFSEQNVHFLNQSDYIVFYQKIDLNRTALNNKHDQELLFNDHLSHKRILQNLFPHVEVHFRLELDTEFPSDFQALKKYLVFLSHAKAFSKAHNFSYFIVEAFDNGIVNKTGWWALRNGGDPTNVKSYVEREAAFSGRLMRYPDPITYPSENLPSTDFPAVLLAIVGLSVLLLISIVVGSLFIVRYCNLRKIFSDKEVREFLHGKPTNLNVHDAKNYVCAAESKKFEASFQLQLRDISFEWSKILGSGNFGTVVKGDVKGTPAAIKQPNTNCSKDALRSVLTEIKVLCYLGVHPNIIEFIGAYTKEIQQGILYVATELCSSGSLEKLLRTTSSVVLEDGANIYQNIDADNWLNINHLHRFAMEIANGMQYIESKNVVHGDLAARNVLLDEHLTCKIGDFGLSRKLYEYQKYVKKSQEPLPWKWMAVESLSKMEFTSKSDVWSFGVTVWEIYAKGDLPYAGLNWSVNFVEELRNGLRLSIPQYASENIFKIMKDCWNVDVEQRPNFTTLVEFFKPLCSTPYIVLGEASV